jgi:WD40 repeat protein
MGSLMNDKEARRMPTLVTKIRVGLNELRETLFRRLLRARFRYDVFISYSHRDAQDYAENLKNQLKALDFSCFIDEEESPPGSSLDPTLAKALKKSAVLVLLATERALTRPYIISEFEKFANTGRTIVPINLLGALTNNEEAALATLPWKTIKDRKLVWIDENDDAFARQNPSPEIADGIDKQFKYTRRNTRVRMEIIGTAVVAVLLASMALFVIKGKVAEVARQTATAQEARAEATKQLKIADDAREEAKHQLQLAADAKDEAQRQSKLAEEATAKAERQQKIADQAKAEAEKQQRIAREATLAAEKQKQIASARQLANEAELIKGGSSAEIVKSASTAIRSLVTHPTLEGDLALRAKLQLMASPPKEETYEGRFGTVAISPDAQAVAFLTPDSEMNIRRAGAVQITRKRPSSHSLIALSNGGRYAATAGGHTVRVENLDNGQVWEFPIFDEADIKAIALSSGGKYLAMIARAEEGVWTEVYDLEIRKPVGQPIHGSIDFSNFQSVAFSGDKEAVLAVGGEEKSGGSINWFVRTWEIQKETGNRSQCLKAECQEQVQYVFSPRSTLRQAMDSSGLAKGAIAIALTQGDNYVVIFGSQTTEVWRKTRLGDYRQISGLPIENPLAIAFANQGEQLRVVSQPRGWFPGLITEVDKSIQTWESSGHAEKARKKSQNEILGVSFRPDANLVTTVSETFGDGQGGVQVWAADDLGESKQHETGITAQRDFEFSADGRYLAIQETNSVVVWDLVKKQSLAPIVHESFETLKAVRLSFDGRFVALAGNSREKKQIVRVYQNLNGTFSLSRTLSVQTNAEFLALAISRDGLVAFPTSTFEVKIWSAKTGNDVTPKNLVSRNKPQAIIFSPNGRLMAGMSPGIGKIFVWDVVTGRTMTTLTGSQVEYDLGHNHNIAFSHDGDYLAAGNEADGTVKVWQLSTGEQVLLLQHDDPVVSVSFSRDGKYLATATTAVDPDTAQGNSYALWTWLIRPKDLISETCGRSPRLCKPGSPETFPGRPLFH